MKILIAADTYYPHVNGAAYFAQRLAFYLNKRGHQVLVVAPSLNINSEFFEHNQIKFFGVSSYPIPGIKGFRFSLPIFQKNKIKKIMKAFNPDVVHLQSHFYINKAVFDISRKAGYPIMGTNHFMPENLVHYLHLPKRVENQVKKFAWKQFRAVFKKLSFVTAPTKTAANLAMKNGFPREIIPISNGIDLNHFTPGRNGEYLKEKYNLPNKPTLIFVGRLDKEKKVDFILKALPGVLKKVDINFIVAGKGKEKEKLEKLAKRLKVEKNVSFLGFVPDEDLRDLFSLADCFVNACEAELQCIAAMEAMASGLPIIGVNALALPELIQHGESGYLFEPGDKKTLTGQIINIFSDNNLRQRMAAKSLEMIKKHGIENTISSFEELYLKLKK
ncbi:MAG: glycosyltransferase [Candidatus Moranbacteria bacterium]|nr:glycosyltransferase [Candidatus Moranbacteria bacterium]